MGRRPTHSTLALALTSTRIVWVGRTPSIATAAVLVEVYNVRENSGVVEAALAVLVDAASVNVCLDGRYEQCRDFTVKILVTTYVEFLHELSPIAWIAETTGVLVTMMVADFPPSVEDTPDLRDNCGGRYPFWV